MKFEELRNQPVLLFPAPKNEVHFTDKDHVWINGRQYISLKRVGEMMKEKRITNADRIRAMTDEELAEFIGGIFTIERDPWGDYDPRTVVTQEPRVELRSREDALDWLRQEAE